MPAANNDNVPIEIVGELTGVIVNALVERSTNVALLQVNNTVLGIAVSSLLKLNAVV